MKTSMWLQMAQMAWQYLKRRKLRTTLTTLAIVLGVALIFAINLIMPSVLDSFKQSQESDIADVDLSIADRTGESFDPEPITQTLLELDGVKAVSGVLRRRNLLPTENNPLGALSQIEIIGVDPDILAAVRAYDLRDGRLIQTNGEVVVSAAIGQVGDTITVPTASGLQSFTV
ncbi:MAG: ABC transporter permease, partial [Anaerolineae bacterium]|nr:ABC transporter permease [Anaerolineae bacterium]